VWTDLQDGVVIGARLREARRSRGLSLNALAERSGLTKGFLSQVERDLTSPSVGTLLKLCAALDLPVGELFSGGTGPVVRAADRAPVAFGGEGVTEWQLTPADERRLLVLESEIAPGGGSGPDAYGLESEAEFVHVLEGVLDLEVAGTRYRLAAGDSLTFDADAPHRWTNPSTVRATRVVWVLVPGLS
jgi:transcriptional regulator with XRE-family HTH domain